MRVVTAPLNVSRIAALVRELRGEAPGAVIPITIHNLDRERFDALAGEERYYGEDECIAGEFWAKRIPGTADERHVEIAAHTTEPPAVREAAA